MGERLYAIGDIHGRVDLLQQLLEKIDKDRSDTDKSVRTTLVFLGDYIDRGPQSQAVLDMVATFAPPDMTVIRLRGNHEQILIDLLDPAPDLPALFANWLGFGGRETLASYGVASSLIYGDDLDALHQALLASLPARHQNFLKETVLSYQRGDYFFCHAGVEPGIAFAHQRPRDLLWMREPFLSSKLNLGGVVVHGHTIDRQIQIRPNRIGIDTGAYATNVLTAVVLEGNKRRFLQTGS